MRSRIFILLAVVALPVAFVAAQGKQTFTGVITDDECPKGDHSAMRMGPSDAECVTACAEEHGALYILYDGKKAYNLSDQKMPTKFAAQKVNVTGTLDSKTNTIRVNSISQAK
jgi:hypothetical protein